MTSHAPSIARACSRARPALPRAPLAAALVALAAACSKSSPTDAPAPAPFAPAPAGLTLATIGAPFVSWKPLDVPGRVGTFEAIDPVANLAWAQTIATAWKPDAAVYRVDLSGATKDGTVNVTVGAKTYVDYWIQSPRCLAEYKASTAAVDPKTPCELRVSLNASGGAPRAEAMLEHGDTAHPALKAPASCTLAQAFGVMEHAGKTSPVPVYDVQLSMAAGPRKVGRDGGVAYGVPGPYPTWYIRTDMSRPGHVSGMIDAVSCALAY